MTINFHSAFRILFFPLVSILMISCEHKPVTETRYYNIDSLVDAQINLFRAGKTTLTKISLLNSKTDSSITTPKDSLAWSNQLDVFKQLGVINKPTNKGLYTVTNEKDTKSNLMVRTFTASKKKDLPLAFLKIYYHDTFTSIRKIEGSYAEKNYLYYNSLILSMEFDNLYNKITLTNYTIKGTQKMVAGDTVNFTIHGKVKIN